MKAKRVAVLLIAIIVQLAVAQAPEELENRHMLEEEKFVLILEDGEQVVIRGDYEVRGDRVYFYYDLGNYPVYAMLKRDEVDFEATARANDKLRRERIRRANYYRLIEEVQRSSLEGDITGPFIVDTGEEGVAVEPEYEDELREDTFYLQTARNFPPYDEEDLEVQPEPWWRQESRRLFQALEESNTRLSQLNRDHNAIALQIRQAENREEEQRLREQLQQFRDALQTERNLARLIGNRLVELSEYAEKLEIPMDWIIPDDSSIYEEETP